MITDPDKLWNIILRLFEEEKEIIEDEYDEIPRIREKLWKALGDLSFWIRKGGHLPVVHLIHERKRTRLRR
jgi:hypothetical protein